MDTMYTTECWVHSSVTERLRRVCVVCSRSSQQTHLICDQLQLANINLQWTLIVSRWCDKDRCYQNQEYCSEFSSSLFRYNKKSIMVRKLFPYLNPKRSYEFSPQSILQSMVPAMVSVSPEHFLLKCFSLSEICGPISWSFLLYVNKVAVHCK